MPEIRTVKIIVGFMTLLVVVMFGFVLYGLSRQSAPAPLQTTVWESTLPAGATLVGLGAAGSYITVLADTPEGRKVYVFDPRSGEIRGTLSTAH